MNASHCPRCGHQLPVRPQAGPPVVCPSCSYEVYLNARPAAGAVVIDGDRFLAVRRAHAPFQGLWDVPGGFCDATELPEQTAVREVLEETGVHIGLDRFVGHYLDDYHFQGESFPVLNCYWLARPLAGAARSGLDPEVSEVGWLSLASHPDLAFAHVPRMMADALRLVAS